MIEIVETDSVHNAVVIVLRGRKHLTTFSAIATSSSGRVFRSLRVLSVEVPRFLFLTTEVTATCNSKYLVSMSYALFHRVVTSIISYD